MKLSNVDLRDIDGPSSISGVSADGVYLSMKFQEQWAERILVLRRGSRIQIIGKIRRVMSGTMFLVECEILSSSAPSDPKSPALQSE